VLVASGCGGDDDEADNSPAQTTAAESSESPDSPVGIDEVKQRLEADGYSVEEKPGSPLLRNEASRGGIVKSDAELVVTGGDLPSGADVSVHSFTAPEDVEAVKRLAGGGVSLVKGSLFFQASEPGAADKVAEAATG
jgi:hypothetical protein